MYKNALYYFKEFYKCTIKLSRDGVIYCLITKNIIMSVLILLNDTFAITADFCFESEIRQKRRDKVTF